MITATITRPTSLAPTIHCDQKVYLLERIDISQLYPPRERTITLEPISRRTRAKSQAKKIVDSSERKSVKGDSSKQTHDREQSESLTTTSSPSLRAITDTTLSLAPSDLSVGEPARGSRPDSDTISRPSERDSNGASSRPSGLDSASTAAVLPPKRAITATVASLSGGCLRGDSLTVKVHIDHTKHVKSLHGVIITLYRQARVDMHPAIPLGPIEKGKERKYEDYYPKSVSGLGGLSLSGAGSNHVFRKDLSQTILPLIVDPVSLTADVTGKVHVPDEAFPTISTVPGAMISFRYYIEVVLDIQGKLSSHDRNLGNLGGLASTIAQGSETDRDRLLNGFSVPVVDTATVRRDKGVVTCTFEVIIGTRDTRRKGKNKIEVAAGPETERQYPLEADTQAGVAQSLGDGTAWRSHAAAQAFNHHYQAYPHTPGHGAHNGQGSNENYDDYNDWGAAPSPGNEYLLPSQVPMPVIEDESQLSEKERLRRAEARLLPSQPPGFDEAGPSGSAHDATAPYLPEEQHDGYTQHDGYHHPPFLPSPPASAGAYIDATTVPVAHTLDFERRGLPLPGTSAYNSSEVPGPRTPSYEASQIPLPRTPACERTEAEAVTATDDKRELHRRQLELEASAPPQHTVDESGPVHLQEPSAPIFSTDDDVYATGTALAHDSHANASALHDLPRYER